jgi:hypothetical protein
MRQGFSILPAAVVEALPRLSHGAVRLAAALGRFADGEGRCFPSVKALMAAGGIRSWATFEKAREELGQLGLRDRHASHVFRCRATGCVPTSNPGLSCADFPAHT